MKIISVLSTFASIRCVNVKDFKCLLQEFILIVKRIFQFFRENLKTFIDKILQIFSKNKDTFGSLRMKYYNPVFETSFH